MDENNSRRVPLGNTGLEVSRLITAAWSFAGRKGPLGGRIQPEDIERSFHELGLNSFFVTPKMKDAAEGVRRLIRSGHREEMVIISVMGIPLPRMVDAFWRRCTKALELDTIDILLMGWVQYRFYLRPSVWEALQKLKESGQVGALGFSIHNRKLAARLAGELDPAPDVLMLRYNAAHRGAETEIFPRLSEPKPGVIAYTATRWGDLLKSRSDLGFEKGMTASECYRFALMHPAVDAVLCGARTFAELQEDVDGIADGPLSEERYQEVVSFGDAVHSKPTRRGTRYAWR